MLKKNFLRIIVALLLALMFSIVISIIPGIQNLAAAGELTKSVVASTYEGAATGEIEDGFLFGARAKLIEYVVADDEAPFMGIHAASIVNQSCYFMNAMFYEGIMHGLGLKREYSAGNYMVESSFRLYYGKDIFLHTHTSHEQIA